jgi:hypothetical protein
VGLGVTGVTGLGAHSVCDGGLSPQPLL